MRMEIQGIDMSQSPADASAANQNRDTVEPANAVSLSPGGLVQRAELSLDSFAGILPCGLHDYRLPA